ncbi:anti-sigma factor antagonist [Aerosakkonemataceae cyanobacterium BLCC-F154]|uniref:Anti-sigma factor antagonist n=1 Tax=Floridaenema fluviatile BLCC-F154 TaxID=3153640 RepID=A0ABV4YCB5_9CYAN
MAFTATLETKDSTATITLTGTLDASTAPTFKAEVEKAAAENVKTLILMMEDLEYMASAGLRVLIYTKQKMGAHSDIYVVKPQEMVVETLDKTGFIQSVIVVDDLAAIEKG